MRILLALMLVSLIGCNGGLDENDAAASAELNFEDKDWILVSYGYQESSKEPPIEGTSYRLRFNSADNKVGGTIDCNLMSSTYSRNGSELTLSGVATTRVGCLLRINEGYRDEVDFITFTLRNVAKYEVNADLLTLTSTDSRQLIYQLDYQANN